MNDLIIYDAYTVSFVIDIARADESSKKSGDDGGFSEAGWVTEYLGAVYLSKCPMIPSVKFDY